MNYWPGTNIPRSRGNAFDWRNYKTGFDVAAFRKQNASPAADTAFGMKGGTIPGMGLMDVKLLAAKPALKAHVSKAQAMKRG